MDLNPSPPAHLSAELLLGPVTGSLRRGLEKASRSLNAPACGLAYCLLLRRGVGGRKGEREMAGGVGGGGGIVQIKINRSKTGLLWTPTS